MLENYEKFLIPDLSKKHNFTIEVNWNSEDEKTNQCKVLKCTFPNGDQVFIDKKHLLELLFAIGSPEEQRSMIPQKIQRTRLYQTMIGVRAKKDIKQGEMINFPVRITLPTFEQEAIAELIPAGVRNQISKNPVIKGRLEQFKKAKNR